jgi:hypothetical protein
MKKSIYYLFGIFFIGLSLFLLIQRKTMLANVDVKIVYVDQFEKEEPKTIKFCAIDRLNNFDLIDIEIPDDIKDVYLYVFELYNYKRNTLPLEYNVVSNSLLDVIKYEKIENKLTFDLEDSDILEDDLYKTMYALFVTYKFMEIEELEVKINNQVFNSNDYFPLK